MPPRTEIIDVQRVRKAIEPVHQSRSDWMITSAIAKEMGTDLGYGFSASAVFRKIADSMAPYEGLRYPDLKDESNPAALNYEVRTDRDVSGPLAELSRQVAGLEPGSDKNNARPRVGHKLHRITTMTGKTEQFHLLANGNPKPENLLVSPLVQFELDGSPKSSNGEKNTEEIETAEVEAL